jgi:HlyD family type I secretion membrane fusion protein
MGTEVITRPAWLTQRRRTDIVGDVVGAFESETAAVLLETAPKREHVTVWVLVGFLALVVLLSCVINVDIVIEGVGKISPLSGVLYISPYNTGIVKALNVRAGEFVKKGQPLATLDPTFTQADLTQLKEHLSSDEAVVARESAEVANAVPVFPHKNDYQKLQDGIWHKRQEEYKSNVGNFDSQIHSLEAVVQQYRSDVIQYTQRVKLAGEVVNVYTPLETQGYVSKLQVMSAVDTRTEMERLLADARQQVDSNSQTIAALKAQREAYIQKWHSDTGTQLVTDSNDFDATRQLLNKAQKMEDLNTLDSPEDAIVVKVGKLSRGSVYQGGGTDAIASGNDPLFTLMPVNAPLFADVYVPSSDIGFVRLGQEVRMKLDAYRYTEYGVAKGKVKSVSENSFTVDDNNQPTTPYFKVHVAITDAHLRGVSKDFRLLPGDTLLGDVMVGKRTIMSYLVEGILRTTSEAMREP